jgi:hypothetical protein
MNHAFASNLPVHIQVIRENSIIWTRMGNEWVSKDHRTISKAKKEVRLTHGCTGGPKSFVRTSQSLGM